MTCHWNQSPLQADLGIQFQTVTFFFFLEELLVLLSIPCEYKTYKTSGLQTLEVCQFSDQAEVREGSNEGKRGNWKSWVSTTVPQLGNISVSKWFRDQSRFGGDRWLLSFICGQMALFILGLSHIPGSVQTSKLNLLHHSTTYFFNAGIKGKLLSKL